MNEQTVRIRLQAAVETLLIDDSYLLEIGVSERAIMGRLAVYLTHLFPSHSVDLEYNRHALEVKRADVPEECANATNFAGKAIIIPDLIVHQRGHDRDNLLVLEAKKSADRRGKDCDRLRVTALKRELGYRFAALLEFPIGGSPPHAPLVHWV